MPTPEPNQRLGRFVETPVAGEIVRAFVPPPLPPAPPIDVLALLGPDAITVPVAVHRVRKLEAVIRPFHQVIRRALKTG